MHVENVLSGPVSSRCNLPSTVWTVGFSGARLYLCLQTANLSDAQALPTSWHGGGTRGLQFGGHVHKEAVHLLSLQLTSITNSGAF